MSNNNSFSNEFSVHSLIHTPKPFSQENDTESIKFNFIDNISYSSKFSDNFDDIYLQKKEDNKINQIKNENEENKEKKEKKEKNEKNENKVEIENDNKPKISKKINNENYEEYQVSGIINIINRALELYEKGEMKFDGMILFYFISFLESRLHKEEFEIMKNAKEEEMLKLPKYFEKIDLLAEIKDIKIKEKNEELEDDSKVKYLTEKLILFEEEYENNKEIRKEIKAEAGNNPDPIKKLNITIDKFIIIRLKEQKNYFMRCYEKIKEEINEEKEINFLERKRKFQENEDIEENGYEDEENGKKEEDSLSSIEEEKENGNKRKRYRSDNILIMFKRNLIQQIFLDWINEGESNKKEKLSKIDPEIFRKAYNFDGKKLKEIYSEKISIKSKTLDKLHNIDVIKGAKGLKNIKLNLSFEQALKIFFSEEINENEISDIIDEEKKKNKNFIFNEIDMIKGLKNKEDYIHEKSEGENISFEKKLIKILDMLEKKYLA